MKFWLTKAQIRGLLNIYPGASYRWTPCSGHVRIRLWKMGLLERKRSLRGRYTYWLTDNGRWVRDALDGWEPSYPANYCVRI